MCKMYFTSLSNFRYMKHWISASGHSGVQTRNPFSHTEALAQILHQVKLVYFTSLSNVIWKIGLAPLVSKRGTYYAYNLCQNESRNYVKKQGLNLFSNFGVQ